MALLWGIDLGGTKIEAAVLDSADGLNCLIRKRISTEADKGYEHILSRINGLINSVAEELGAKPAVVGIGHPGASDPTTGLLRNSNTVCMNRRPFYHDITARLGIPIVGQNDANCFAVAEATLGAGKGAATVFGIIMGTGVGGGLVVDGRVLSGHQGIAGEWGHNILIPDGPECYCGRKGCVETILSGPGLEKFYAELSGHSLRLPEIWERAHSGRDPAARQTMLRLTEYFGRGLAVVINIFDPDVVVLGGGVSNTEELLTDGRVALEKWVFHERCSTPIVRNQLGDSAGVLGAALLVSDYRF